jgi:hypothetical protein
LTGFRLKRNSDQSEQGGYDLKVDLTELKSKQEKLLALQFDEFAFEIKNTKEGFVPAYWKQTLEQAQKYNRVPVLFYKIPLKGWRVVMHLADMPVNLDGFIFDEEDILHMVPSTFFKIVGLYNPKPKEK